MKQIIWFFVGLLGISLLTQGDAEARRMGGGSNVGKQYSVPAQPARPAGSPATAATPSKPMSPAGAPASGASRWLGPLAGIAAGGLLAAMLFGDGFDGLQVLDLLLFAALALGAVMLFRRMRRGAPQLAGAGALGGGYSPPVPKDLPLGASGSAAPAVGFDAPAWFDESGFVGGAKRHFVALQAAWDQGDLGSLREYATPELLDELTRERTRLGAERHETEVVTLEAALAGIRRDGDQVVASILFSGLIREGHGARPEPFREIWHVAHAWESAAGDWLLTGIQQVSD